MGKLIGIMSTISFLLYTTADLIEWCPEQKFCTCNYGEGEDEGLYLLCTDIDDLSDIKQCLSDHFSNVTIRSVDVFKCNATSMPSEIIANISIESLEIKCPVSNFSADAFLGSKSMFSNFRLTKHDLSRIPDAFSHTPNLQELYLSLGLLERLDEQVKSLSYLKKLLLDENKIEYVSPNAFKNLTSILHVDLSRNLIKYIDPNMFAACKSIEVLSLSHNFLESVNGLLDFINPEQIMLEANRLTDIDDLISTNLNTEKTYSSNNLLIMKNNYVSHDAVISTPQLKRLDVFLNDIRTISGKALYNLTSLELLNLSRNKLNSIKGIFNNHRNLISLDISYNRIEDLEDSLDEVPNLEELRMENNYLQALTDQNIGKSTHVQILMAGSNNISIITNSCFKNLTNIQYIDLAFNKLVSLNGSISHLMRLQFLHLEHNNIDTLLDNDLQDLPSLSTINFEGNKLSSLNGQFKYLQKLKKLNLRKNRILTLSRNTFPDEIVSIQLHLQGNPLVCDYRLDWIGKWPFNLRSSSSPFIVDDATCQAPFRYQGVKYKYVPLKPRLDWEASCPLSCKCCYIPNGEEVGIKVDCSHNNLTDVPEIFPPRTISVDMSHNNLINFRLPSLKSTWTDLQEVNIENNKVTSVEGLSFLRYLSVLKMANNRLERFEVPDKATYNLVTLSGNPWICDCSTVPFRDWLVTFKYEISDIGEVKCGKGTVETEIDDVPIMDLSESDICPPKIALYLSASIGILGFLLLIASSVMMYSRYRLNIKVWLYSHGFTWVKEDEIDKDKEFDAFVSFSSHDDKFVYTILVPTLENGMPPFFLCVHERNFPVGNSIHTSIISAVKNSKRTILILSNNFLESEWCTLEYRAAHLQALKDKINRIIVIVYGDLPPEKDIDEELRVYLKSTTYLIWGEKYFWQKLHYALPKVVQRRERVNLHYDKNIDLLVGF